MRKYILLASVGVVVFLVTPVFLLLFYFTLCHSIALLNPITTSTAPNQAVKVGLYTHGFFGATWVDLIENHFWGERTTIYTEEGNEIIFPTNVQIIWSKDSFRFLVIYPKLQYQSLKKDPSICLDYEQQSDDGWGRCLMLALMYDLNQKRLWHNLYPSPKNQYERFNLNNVRDIDWVEKLSDLNLRTYPG